jgi:hypothetical protein
VDGTAGAGIKHIGPGTINIKNILVTGPNYYVLGQVGFSAVGNMRLDGCSAWGTGDANFAVYAPAGMTCNNCNSSACASRGFAASGTLSLSGGGACGNASHGVEIAHGARCGTEGLDLTISTGFQSICNGGCGISAQSGYVLFQHGTVVSNGGIDLYGWNMGVVASNFSSVGTVSPYWNTEGNLNSIAVLYN